MSEWRVGNEGRYAIILDDDQNIIAEGMLPEDAERVLADRRRVEELEAALREISVKAGEWVEGEFCACQTVTEIADAALRAEPKGAR